MIEAHRTGNAAEFGFAVRLHVLRIAADECFIALNNAAQHCFVIDILDGFADTVTEIPRGFIRNTERAF